MINFVVVEDNKMHRERLKLIINKCMMSNKREYIISEFSDYNKNLSKLINNDDKYKIYILDFELPSANAIEIAREIRNKDWTSAIIVNSAYPAFAYETFKQRLEILDFVSKQIDEERNLLELFDICLKKADSLNRIKLKVNYSEVWLNPEKILYIYRNNKKTYVVTDTDEYKTYKTMHVICEELGNKFVQSHRCCYINKNRVREINWKDKFIVFDNNKTCEYLSFNFYEELKKDDYK